MEWIKRKKDSLAQPIRKIVNMTKNAPYIRIFTDVKRVLPICTRKGIVKSQVKAFLCRKYM
ncbi:MAG: hypothetical protein RR814_05320, partial [Oscillospiraceae bacterium]